MKLMAEILKDPAFPETDFEQIRQQQITGIDRGRTEPTTLAAQALQANLRPFPRSDVRHARTIDEEIEDLKSPVDIPLKQRLGFNPDREPPAPEPTHTIARKGQ